MDIVGVDDDDDNGVVILRSGVVERMESDDAMGVLYVIVWIR